MPDESVKHETGLKKSEIKAPITEVSVSQISGKLANEKISRLVI